MTKNKMLQAILDGQSGIKGELNDKLRKLDEKVDKGFKEVNERFDSVDKRIDKLGLELAELSDDAPTIEEFDALDERVTIVEKKLASVN